MDTMAIIMQSSETVMIMRLVFEDPQARPPKKYYHSRRHLLVLTNGKPPPKLVQDCPIHLLYSGSIARDHECSPLHNPWTMKCRNPGLQRQIQKTQLSTQPFLPFAALECVILSTNTHHALILLAVPSFLFHPLLLCYPSLLE